jgi:beta-phosphoglucomutase
VLDGLEIRSFFDAIVGANNVQESKPHPQMFLMAAERLGVNPRQCMVFEDSLAGIEGAHRAGMRVIAITTSLRAGEVVGLPSVISAVSDFSPLSPLSLLEILEES